MTYFVLNVKTLTQSINHLLEYTTQIKLNLEEGLLNKNFKIAVAVVVVICLKMWHLSLRCTFICLGYHILKFICNKK